MSPQASLRGSLDPAAGSLRGSLDPAAGTLGLLQQVSVVVLISVNILFCVSDNLVCNEFYHELFGVTSCQQLSDDTIEPMLAMQ